MLRVDLFRKYSKFSSFSICYQFSASLQKICQYIGINSSHIRAIVPFVKIFYIIKEDADLLDASKVSQLTNMQINMKRVSLYSLSDASIFNESGKHPLLCFQRTLLWTLRDSDLHWVILWARLVTFNITWLRNFFNFIWRSSFREDSIVRTRQRVRHFF